MLTNAKKVLMLYRETTIFSSVKQRRFKNWKANMLAIN
jgi:hypothetical protein